MVTKIARNDAVVQRQVTVLTPTVVNGAVYDILINTKNPGSFTASGAATAQEIVEGLQPILTTNALGVIEAAEMVWTEDNATIIATGLATGKPFTIVEGPGSGNWASITTSTVAKSPNHWIAENFNGGLPAAADDVIITGLASTQGFYWGLDQSAVDLASLDIRLDCDGHVGLPEINTDAGAYYQTAYRDTHLKIGTSILKIGDGQGQGCRRVKIQLNNATACAATVYNTGEPIDQDEGAVHLSGSNAANTLQVLQGKVDIAMLPGHTSQWATIVASGGTTRLGTGVTLATLEAAGQSVVETRNTVTTVRTRDSGRVTHIGSGNIDLLDIQGGPVVVQATGALTIAQLNLYPGKTLDLSKCDSLVTVTAMTVYGTPDAPSNIVDPNNKLVMTAAASCPNGAQSLKVVTGSSRTVRVV